MSISNISIRPAKIPDAVELSPSTAPIAKLPELLVVGLPNTELLPKRLPPATASSSDCVSSKGSHRTRSIICLRSLFTSEVAGEDSVQQRLPCGARLRMVQFTED